MRHQAKQRPRVEEVGRAHEAELAVVSVGLLHPQVLEWVDLPLSCFAEHRTRAGWEALQQLRADDTAIDETTFAAKLKELGKYTALGGNQFIAELGTVGGALPSNVEHYVRLVRQAHLTRSVLLTAGEAPTWAAAGVLGEELLDEVMGQLGRIDRLGSMESAETISAGTHKLLRDLDDFIAAREKGESVSIGVAFGIEKLDDLTGGSPLGEPTVLAGRPGQGKSSFLAQMALINGFRGDGGHLFSFEDRAEKYWAKMLGHQAGISWSRINKREIIESHERTVLRRAANELRGMPVIVEHVPGKKVSWIKRQVLANRRQNRTRWIAVDYIQRMKPLTRGQKKTEQIEENVDELVRFCGEQELGLVICSQLSREAEKRGNDEPKLGELAGSDALGQAAKVCIYLEHDREHRRLTCIVPKYNAGDHGVIHCDFNAPLCRIRS